MALDLFRARLGISIDDEASIIHGTVAPTAGAGASAPEGSLYLRNNGGAGELWMKTGALDTDWRVISTNDENGYQNTFMGKPTEGSVTPDYTSVNQVTDGQSLVDAVSGLDAAIGPDLAAGLHYLTAGDTVTGALEDLDAQVYVNTQAISALATSITWRDPAYVITVDTYTNGAAAPTTFSDAEKVIAAPAEGALILSKTSNKVYKVVSGLLVEQALLNGYTYMVENTLLNSPSDKENQTIWTYSGSAFVKVGDFNWQLADGINLTSGYSAAGTVGRPAAGSTVQAAISALDGQIGGAVTNGNVITAANTTNANIQALDTALVALPVRAKLASGTHTSAVVDSVPVASIEAVKWLVVAKTASGTRYACEILATNNGVAAGSVDFTEYAQLYIRPKISGLLFNVVVTGANMELLVTSTEACSVGVVRFNIDSDYV